MQGKGFLVVGGLLAGSAVALGALGAHALKDKLSVEQMVSFETAVHYQMYHAIALILVGIVANRSVSRLLRATGWMFALGIVLFSGGIYGWLFTSIKPLVHVVPVGGIIWIVAWICFAVSQFSSSTQREI